MKKRTKIVRLGNAKCRLMRIFQIATLLILSLSLIAARERTLEQPSKSLPPADGARQVTYVIDNSLKPSQSVLSTLGGGMLRSTGVSPPRSVEVMVGPDGKQNEFVVNEVVFHSKNEDDLNAFLQRYGGTMLRDGKRERGSHEKGM